MESRELMQLRKLITIFDCRYLRMQSSEKLENLEDENQQLKQRVDDLLSSTEKAQAKVSKSKSPKGVDSAIDAVKVRSSMHIRSLNIA